jgi:hypothetical protein
LPCYVLSTRFAEITRHEPLAHETISESDDIFCSIVSFVFCDLSDRFIRPLAEKSQKFLITKTGCRLFRFRMSPNSGHPITKLITSGDIQAFPRRLTLFKFSPIKPFLDLSGCRHRKQGFNSPRIQVTYYEALTYITYKKRDNMSTVFRWFPLGFRQIYLDLFPGHKT